MQQQTERVCTACGTHFLLGRGETRTCPGPGCGRSQVASAEPSTRRVASSMRASDRTGYRLLGRHGGQGPGRREAQTPFVVRGQKPDPQTMAIREAQRQSLAEKQAYWRAEVAEIEAKFGPLDAAALERLRG